MFDDIVSSSKKIEIANKMKFTKCQLQILQSVANEMMRDGVTPEMFIKDPDAFSKAYMESNLKKAQRMTDAYFLNSSVRNEVIESSALLLV